MISTVWFLPNVEVAAQGGVKGRGPGVLSQQSTGTLTHSTYPCRHTFCCHKIPCASTDELPRRAKQLWRWMYYDNKWANSFRETLGQQSGLSAAFCDKAEALASVDGGLLLEQVVGAQDGTKKLVFRLTEGAGAGEEGVRGGVGVSGLGGGGGGNPEVVWSRGV